MRNGLYACGRLSAMMFPIASAKYSIIDTMSQILRQDAGLVVGQA
jgi:hypothetical protein